MNWTLVVTMHYHLQTNISRFLRPSCYAAHLTPSFCVCVCVFVTLLPWRQAFASKLHYHVVIEYIGQLMKSNYSCKNRKHEKAATKIRHQWNKLSDLFEDMVIKSSLPYQH